MPAARKPSALEPTEVRVTIPPRLLDLFAQEPRIVIKWRPDGLWPIGPEILRQTDLLQKLAADKEFNQKFEVVIMAKG